MATNPNALLSDKNTLGNASPRSPRSGTRRSKSKGSNKGNSPRNAGNQAAAGGQAAAGQGNQGHQEEEKKQHVMQEIFHEIHRPDPQPLPQEPDVSIGILKADTFIRKEREHAEQMA